MIYGIGTDICDIRRIEAALARRGQRFAHKVLGPRELKIYEVRQARVAARGLRYLATRFAAKEAFAKAIGLGIHMPMTWRSCEILNAPGGRPEIELNGGLAAWFDARGLRATVSVSDESDYAVAFVIVETAQSAA